MDFINIFFYSGPPSMLVTAVNSILSFVGIELAPAIEDSSKPVRMNVEIGFHRCVLFSTWSLGLSLSLQNRSLER